MSLPESKEPVTTSAALLVFLPEGGEERHPLRGRETTIGRDPSNHICIANPLVSGFHAKILRSGETFSLVDLGSANKTRVNGRSVVQKAVSFGDEIHIAGVVCRLAEPSGSATEDYSPSEPGANHGFDRSVFRVQEIQTASDGAQFFADSGSEKWKPPVSKLYLTGGILALFSIIAALATQVC